MHTFMFMNLLIVNIGKTHNSQLIVKKCPTVTDITTLASTLGQHFTGSSDLLRVEIKNITGREKYTCTCTCILFVLHTVTPHTRCRLKLLKVERIKDFLLMEEELIRNMEHLKPQEQRNEVGFVIIGQFGVHWLHIQVVTLLFLAPDQVWLAKCNTTNLKFY